MQCQADRSRRRDTLAMRTILGWVLALVALIGAGVGVEAAAGASVAVALSRASIDQIAIEAATQAGDAHPTSVTWVLTDKYPTSGCSYDLCIPQPPFDTVYLLEIEGHFLNNVFSTVQVTVNPSTGSWGGEVAYNGWSSLLSYGKSQTDQLLASHSVASATQPAPFHVVGSDVRGNNRRATRTVRGHVPPPGSLIACSGSRISNREIVSFDGAEAVWRGSEIGGRMVVRYRGHMVISTRSAPGFAVPINAPLTSGNVCIASMGVRTSPVVFDYAVNGVCCGSTLQAIYEAAGGRYRVAAFQIATSGPFRLAVLHKSVAVIANDGRFLQLVMGDASIEPIQIARVVDGHLVDVSLDYRGLIAADAQGLAAGIRGPRYRVEGPLSFVGHLDAWVADECRLGNGQAAWRAAETEVKQGRYHHWMNENVPHWMDLLRKDLKGWGYCVSVP